MAEELKISDLQWSKSTETLDDLLQNPKVRLPQLIRLLSDLTFSNPKQCVQGGEILNLLDKQTASYVIALDSRGKEIGLPLHCPFPVRRKVSPENEKTYCSVMEIIKAEQLPKFVEVVSINSTSDISLEPNLKVGEILKVVFVERSCDLPIYVHFRSAHGTPFKVDVNEDISFQTAVSYASTLLLSNLFEQHSREFPAVLQFMKGEKIPKHYYELGTFTLYDRKVYDTEVLFLGGNISQVPHAIIYPLNTGVRFEVNSKLKLANDKGYRQLCDHFTHISASDMETYLNETIGLNEIDHQVMIKYKKIRKQIQKTSISKPDAKDKQMKPCAIRSSVITLSAKENKDLHEVHASKTKPKKDDNNKKDKRKSFKLKPSIEPSENNCQLTMDETHAPQKVSKERKAKDGKKKAILEQKDENIDDHLGTHHTSLLSRVRSLGSHKAKKEKLKSPVENFNPRIPSENLYSQIEYETLDQFHRFDEFPPSLLPPPLPGNHPFQEKVDTSAHYIEAIDSKRGYLDKLTYSSIEIATWGIQEVGNCLTELKLKEYRTLFEEKLIDGKLLLELDESVFDDLGLNIFQAFKLGKFVKGWRSGTLRPIVYPPLHGYSSDDPLDWSIADTILNMDEIEIPEMAIFCRENQVNGELLKDMCTNESVMNFVLPGKKLEHVKLKNYVVDKWRPKKMTESEPCYAVYDDTPRNSPSRKKSNEASLIARMKQQFEAKSQGTEISKKVFA